MKIAMSLVDLSRLPDFPYRLVAGRQIAEALDPYYALRLLIPAALKPLEVEMLVPRPGWMLVWRYSPSPSAGAVPAPT